MSIAQCPPMQRLLGEHKCDPEELSKHEETIGMELEPCSLCVRLTA